MTNDNQSPERTTRRRVLRASGVAALAGFASAPAAASDLREEEYCEQTTTEPSMVHYDDSMEQVCDDDHPGSKAIQDEVRDALEENYPTVGALVDDGFIPYFDFFADTDWAHWINPEYIGDDEVLNADRPESVLVDNTYWRPIGVMFVATDEGEPLDSPPPVYHDEDVEASGGDCTPWHAHTGLPGRYSWWKYQNVHGESFQLRPPCRTPWMMHVWIFDHEHSIYAHDPPAERGGPPAEPPGFETDADPTEEELGPQHLPDAVRAKGRQLL